MRVTASSHLNVIIHEFRSRITTSRLVRADPGRSWMTGQPEVIEQVNLTQRIASLDDSL